MPIPDIAAIADAAKATLDAALITLDGNALKVYAREVRAVDSLPAVSIRMSSFSRRGLDDGEIEIGTTFWDLTYSVRIFVALDDDDGGQADMQAVLARVLDAFDDAPTLGLPAAVDDAVLTSGEQSFQIPDQDTPDVRSLVIVDADLMVRAKST